MTQLQLGGFATGIGSMPGTDAAETDRIVTGELETMPHLPELPARGVGADMIGRGAAMLVDLPTEVVPSGYRVTARSGRDARRGRDLLERDLDTLHELGITPPALKLQMPGPWTLAAGIELPRGARMLTDEGALRDLVASLIEGMTRHVDEVGKRVQAPILVQLDEPSLPAVLGGRLRTPSGFGQLSEVPEPDVQRVLAEVIDAAKQITGQPVIVHCCAKLDRVPVAMMRRAGADALAVDLSGFAEATGAVCDRFGELLEDGAHLLAGLVPSHERAATLREHADPALVLADRLGFARTILAQRVVPTPTCGLASATPDWAQRALRWCGDLAKAFIEPPQSW